MSVYFPDETQHRVTDNPFSGSARRAAPSEVNYAQIGPTRNFKPRPNEAHPSGLLAVTGRLMKYKPVRKRTRKG